MKRIAAFIAAAMLSIPIACADIPDFSTMPNAEIMDIINAGRNVLYVSEPIEGELARSKTDDGLTIIITGIDPSPSNPEYIFLNFTVVNNSDSDRSVVMQGIFINGWKVFDGVYYAIEAHRRSKESCTIFLGDADLQSMNGVEDIEIRLVTYSDGWEENTTDTIYIKW